MTVYGEIKIEIIVTIGWRAFLRHGVYMVIVHVAYDELVVLVSTCSLAIVINLIVLCYQVFPCDG